MYAFAGVLVHPGDLPRFWIFMYRVNPFTYLASSFLSAAIGEAPVHCAAEELLAMEAPGSQTCEQYLSSYIRTAGGYIVDPSAIGICQYCPVKSTTDFLGEVGISFANRWRDFGLLWVYICFNIAAACALYWLCRMPKRTTKA
jgi:ATP-binding cassette subfamily G (WHITE) protein 2 (PDR)